MSNNHMLRKFVEIYRETGDINFRLRERWINPHYIVSIMRDENMERSFNEGELAVGNNKLEPKSKFSRISLERGHSGIDMVVVGDPIVLSQHISV